ncbi:MAG: MFS transporter [Pseudomonadota bacterium]
MSQQRSPILTFGFAYALSVCAASLHGRFNALPETIMQAYALKPSGFGWLISLANLAPLLLAGVAGSWIWVLGMKRSLILGAVLQGGFAIGTTFSRDTAWAFLLRGFEGFPYLVIVVAAPTLIAMSASGPYQTRLLAFWGTYFFVGVSFASFTGTWGADQIGWRNAFLLMALCQVVLCGPATRSIGRITDAAKAIRNENVRLSAGVWLLCMGFFGIALMAVSLPSIVPLFLSDQLGFDPKQAGVVVGFAVFASAGGSILYGLYGHRVPDHSFGVTASGLAALSLTSLFSLGPGNQDLAKMLCLISFVALGSLTAMAIAAIPKLATDVRCIAVANGLLTQAGSAGALLGPPMYLYLFQSFGWLNVKVFALLVVTSTAVLLYFALRSNRSSKRRHQ